MKAVFSSKKLSSLGLKDISIINDNNGAPIVYIRGRPEKSINISNRIDYIKRQRILVYA